MAITDAQKVDYLWKKIGYAATKTDTSSIKEGFNEAIPSPLQIRADKLMTSSGSIPGTVPGANTSVVTVYTTSLPAECTNDATSSTNRTWLTGLTDWISPEFGSTYQVKVYVHTSGQAGTAASSGTQIFAAGSGNNDEWFFDYQSGVLHFIGTNLPNGVSFTGKSVYVSGARYTGGFGIGFDLGNLTIINTSLISSSNITLDPANKFIFANNSVLTGLADPISNTDAVTLQYLNSILVGVTGSISANNSSISIVDNGITAGRIITNVDGVVVSNVSSTSIDLYVSTNIGNLRIVDRTISSNGNIILDALGTGTVQFAGSDAVWLPVGDDAQRPSNAEEGYFRYNSDRNNIEFFDGTSWNVPGDSSISSQIITPDGSSNTFVLTSNTTTAGTMVSINGVLQRPYTTYNVSGMNIQFAETPLSTDLIEVRTIATGAAIDITSLVRGPISVSLDDSNVNIQGNLVLSTPLAVAYGGTGANTANSALNNLLPVSTNYGYVLTTDGSGGYFFAEGTPGPAGTFDTTYETLSQNVSAYPYTINRTGSSITSVVYTVGGNTITKSFTYNGSGLLVGIAIYGAPLGTTVYTKNLSYSGTQISGVSYSIL